MHRERERDIGRERERDKQRERERDLLMVWAGLFMGAEIVT